jgi:GT2 family glycosyltransferase
MRGADPKAVVVVPTFRRPEMLRATLNGLARQEADFPFAILVVENDAEGLAGQNAAFDVFARERLNGVTIVEPRQGNVEAINTGFAAALERLPNTPFILMMDDDEVASPHWLARMVEAAERSGAGIVGGPVIPQFDAQIGSGMRGHPVFWPIRAPTGPLPMIYGSGNCLIRRSVFAKLGLPAFDVAFNFLGGGDTDFFTRARRAGVSFYWQADALITETVPAARTQPRWVLQRGLRIGAINRRIDRKSKAGLIVLAKDLAILAISPFRFLRTLATSRSVLQAAHPINVALGRLLSIGGVETSQYRAGR